jgi:hypothetical protein
MTVSEPRWPLVFLLFVCWQIPLAATGESLNPEGVEFFERAIRPVLVENCYTCHSSETEGGYKGGLRLDNRDDLLRGGDSGPAIVPGNPEGSLLLQAVKHLHAELKMPPKEKLSSEKIRDLERWVQIGAPDPRTGPVPDPRSGEDHWAFQPVRLPPVPEVQDQGWIQTPIDAFILEKLEEKNFTPAPQADKRTLIRRAFFDVTGLPPSPEEVEAFARSEDPEAFVRVVDQLLDSPHYGEKWGRHWLDVARYADTKGYVFEEERRYPYSYTYRDYVIRAFNEDLPFDRFLVEQLAADLLELGEDKRPLAALGFTTLGRRFLNNQHDIIDDRIDVVTRGMMGLTVSCARCHDHKYDPVSIRDYYSLYGVFASSSEPADKPLLGTLPPEKEYQEYLEEREKRKNELDTFQAVKQEEALALLRENVGDYLFTAFQGEQLGDRSKTEALARERKLDPRVTQKWIQHLSTLKAENDPLFAPWFAYAELEEEDFAEKAREIPARFIVQSSGGSEANPLVLLALAGNPPASIAEVAQRYGEVFKQVNQLWQQTSKALEGGSEGADLEGFSDPHLEAIRKTLYADGPPAKLSDNEIFRLFDVPTAQRVRALRRQVEQLDAVHPGAPPRAMALEDNATPHQPKVFVRGNPHNHGPEVPRQFLEFLSNGEPKPFENGSGRLELAQAIASPENPLTARVFVNRVWMHYFGAGLVRTPSDFGLRADPPTHPELLDYLAARFIQEGWSIKKLHRLILLSSVYQQSTEGNPAYAQTDPNNELLWKMNRQRLDFEGMRDSILAVSGALDLTMGGRAVEISEEPFSPRRTIYGFIERQNLPGVFRTFDFASPDTTSPQRFQTTVPQQALFMMNSPFIIDQARHFAARSEVQNSSNPQDRIRAFYQLAFQRDPSADELRFGLEFISRQELQPRILPDPPAWSYGYGWWDEANQEVNFTALPHFEGKAWQGGEKLPDENLGWVMLNARGGHPGEREKAAIRRWTAPRSLTIEIRGSLRHESEEGDGVIGRVIASRGGELGVWPAQNRRVEVSISRVSVEKGDTIDFIVESNENVSHDSFDWAPLVRVVDGRREAGPLRTEWSARSDFSGPRPVLKPLEPWEQYAQVLLMANELVFVD